MRYLIKRTDSNEIAGSVGGYSSKTAAMNALRWRSDILYEATDYIRETTDIEPGDEFGAAVDDYIREHFEILEVDKIVVSTHSGKTLTVYDSKEKDRIL